MKSDSRLGPRLVFSTDRAGIADHDRAERFRRVMLPHMDAAYNLARYLVRDADAAGDIAQEAFLRAWRGFDGWRGDAPKSWMLTIVRNCHLNHVAQNAKVIAAGNVDDWTGELPSELIERRDPEAVLADKDEATMLRARIEQLPEPFREALVLRELEELSYKEIATITQVPIGTVMSRLARARQLLADLLLPGSQKGGQP